MEIRDRLSAALEDRYRIRELLGEGGMARVYLADDLKHNRRVALKVLRPDVAGSMTTERFLREIEVAARLNHPNILALHDSGEAGGLLYFVMPFVEGESLRERLDREGRLEVSEAMRLAAEIGDALEYAHSQGLVHRDIKPENILLQAGHALVADFGIARAVRGSADRLTRAGTSVGTLAYMSPEQLDDGNDVDRRADVYAMGCVLHEMLTGQNPFEAGSPQAVLARKLTGRVPDVTRERPDVPVTVGVVLEQALRVDAAERFETAALFVAALEKATTRAAVENEERRRQRARTMRWAVWVAGTLFTGAAIWGLQRALAAPGMERVAVLPLENQARDTTQEYLVQGVYEDLVEELSRTVRVINTRSARAVAAQGIRLREMATELAVDGIVLGRVAYDADRVALELQLVDLDGEIVWSRSFDVHPRDIGALYHQVARSLAQQMGVRLREEELVRLAQHQEVDPEVYRLLKQAEFNWQKMTREGIDTAEDYYGAALIRSDSLSAEAWYGLGQVWGLRAQNGYVSASEARERQGPLLARAVELDPNLSGLAAERALTLTWIVRDWEAAGDAFRTALERDPTDSATRQYYAQYLLYMGRDREAVAEAERAAETDPFSPIVQGLYGQFLNFVGRAGEADSVFQAILAREPESPLALSNYRTTYHLLGRYDDAMEVWRRFYEERGDGAALVALDSGYAAGGYRGALTAVAEEYEGRGDPSLHWQIATLHIRAGNERPALDYLERAYTGGDPNAPYLAVDPIFDSLRDEPRFLALIDSLGLPR